MSLSLFVFIGLNVATAMSGAVFKPGDWYDSLTKPPWQPPKWAFPVAWTLFYAMIAVAGWLVWTAAGTQGTLFAFALYGVQLLLNAGWSGVFFGMRKMRLALWEVGALWLSIAATILAFLPHSQGAALLMVPYLAWVSFAAFLNWTMIRLNPDQADGPALAEAG
ncbi:MAG: TspO/MBR family protein [Pseudomonadota bacterium]